MSLYQLFDTLQSNDAANQSWADFIVKQLRGKRILEVACGSGDLAAFLKARGLEVLATDIDPQRLAIARSKHPEVTFLPADLRNLSGFGAYNAILATCDSLNYLQELSEVETFFTQAHQHLTADGVLIFDILSQDRLAEFATEFEEEGVLGGQVYRWRIKANGRALYHEFTLYEKTPLVYRLTERVYFPNEIEKLLSGCGFEYRVYTDYRDLGYKKGERYGYVARRERV